MKNAKTRHVFSNKTLQWIIAWLETRNYPLPPGSFASMCMCFLVVVFKIVDLFVHGDSLAHQPARQENIETSSNAEKIDLSKQIEQ